MRDLGREMRCKVSGVCDAMRGRRGGFLEVRQAGWSWGREQSEETIGGGLPYRNLTRVKN